MSSNVLYRGCVTPRQVAGLQEIVGEDKDFSLLDGFDELSDENQEKIREAVEQGHVADSDWKGVSLDHDHSVSLILVLEL